MRRLPIYLVVDCSESMAGEAISLVEEGIRYIVSSLRSNPVAIETVYLSLITFSRNAQQVVPLTEVTDFIVPKLSIKPGTALGAALRLLVECMQRDVIRTTADTKGDYKPLVFLMTDGQPTDEWESACSLLSKSGVPRCANIYAIGCGPEVDNEILRCISDIVLNAPDLSSESIKQLFVWLSASIQTASVRVGDAVSAREKMAELPPDLSEAVKGAVKQRYTNRPQQTFLHALCQQTKKPYLMRYGYVSEYEIYQPIAAHPLEDLEEEEAAGLPPINSSLLNGAPPCPYCENSEAGMCSCGTIFCISIKKSEGATCPKCGRYLTIGDKNISFDVNRSEG